MCHKLNQAAAAAALDTNILTGIWESKEKDGYVIIHKHLQAAHSEVLFQRNEIRQARVHPADSSGWRWRRSWCLCVLFQAIQGSVIRRRRECVTACHSLAGAGGLGLHSDFRAGCQHVWSGLETKQYPLLDDTKIACGGARPNQERTWLVVECELSVLLSHRLFSNLTSDASTKIVTPVL